MLKAYDKQIFKTKLFLTDKNKIMALSEKEDDELYYLRNLYVNKGIPLSKEMWERRRFLQEKQWENCCKVPTCIGFEGNDTDINCPNCGSLLHKMGTL